MHMADFERLIGFRVFVEPIATPLTLSPIPLPDGCDTLGACCGFLAVGLRLNLGAWLRLRIHQRVQTMMVMA
jgi:hypothetical protein